MGDLIHLDEYRPRVLIDGGRFGKAVHAIPLPLVVAWLKGQARLELGDTEAILRGYVSELLVEDGACTEADVARYAKAFKARQRAMARRAQRDVPGSR